MELTLGLAQEDAGKVFRLPVVRAARVGRTRGQAVHVVWHDTPGRTLAAGGMTLTEQGGVRGMERHRPEPISPWPPATDHQPIEGPAPPETTAAVAAFDGRRSAATLELDGETVTVTLLAGVIHAVATEQHAARLILTGPGRAVAGLARSLAESIVLTVPRQSLAMEAICLADGIPLVPRRRGAPVLPESGLSTREAGAHVLGHLTDILLSLAPVVAEAATGAEPVHQMRVAVRRARSALSIFRPVMDYPDFARIVLGVKHLGQTLGPARDWDVFMTETAPPVEAEFPGQASLAALLKAGARRRVAARTALIAYLGGAEFRLLCLDLACLAAATPGDEEAPPLADFAASVLSTNWKKLIKSARSLGKLDHGAMHATRLKAKRLRYAAEFFAPLFADKPAARFIRRLAELQERLGIFNDAAGVEDLLRELSGGAGHAGGLVLGFTAAKGAGTRPKIVMAWDRLRRRGPFWV